MALNAVDHFKRVILVAYQGLRNLAVQTISYFLDGLDIAVYSLVHERVGNVTELGRALGFSSFIDGDVEHGGEGFRAFGTTCHFFYFFTR
jgi:hypothetical protein